MTESSWRNFYGGDIVKKLTFSFVAVMQALTCQRWSDKTVIIGNLSVVCGLIIEVILWHWCKKLFKQFAIPTFLF